jgi:chlorite dismutase
MVEAPQTEEGWFSLHDFRSIDWDAWREAPERERRQAIEEGESFLKHRELVADADEGDSGLFSVLGHKADLLFVHFRPTLDDLSSIERRFEDTALAKFTERTTSYVSVTEVSGYVSDEYFEDPDSVDAGLRRYIEGKLTPEIPDDEYVCFYPMSKRRGEEHNWYDLSFEDRADLMADHGEVGKQYAGKIKQVIASSVGFDSHEWGVTLFGSDPTDIKDIVYEMRFDPASSRYGEFGEFYIGRRFPPADLGAYLAGETVPTGEADDEATGADSGESHPAHGGGGHHHGEGDHPHTGGDGTDTDDEGTADEDIRGELADLNIYAGKPHGEDVYATVLYSEADVDDLFDEVEGLRGNFDHYGTHVKTAVYEGRHTDRAAVVSIWETTSAAETAAGFLSELPEVVGRAGEESGFGTMGMFYTTKSEHRQDFVDTFDGVEDLLSEMEGHLETDLMINVENADDMFIASQWTAKEDAMAFFGSDEFRETVQWGREVLADRPRHVFLA